MQGHVFYHSNMVKGNNKNTETYSNPENSTPSLAACEGK